MDELQSKFQSQGERFKKPYMKTLMQVRHTNAMMTVCGSHVLPMAGLGSDLCSFDAQPFPRAIMM